MAQVATAEILLRLNTREYDQELARTQQQFASFSRENFALNVNTRDADLALQTTIGIVSRLTTTLKGIGQGAIGEARAFQGALNSLQAISGGTADELGKLRDVAIGIGAATTQTPVQVLKAAEAFSALGFSIGEATDAAPGIVALAESTGSSLESSAGVAAKALNIYKDSLTAVQAANVITATVNSTAVQSVDEFNQAISKAGGVAKNNGESFAGLAAGFGLIRSTGAEVEVSATALKNIFTSLTAPTDTVKEAISGLGLQVRDDAGKFRGLEPVLTDLITKLKGLDDATRDKTILDIFGRDTLGAIQGLVAQGLDPVAESFAQIKAAVDDAGLAANSAATRLQGAGAAINALEGSLDTAKLAIGETLLPVVEQSAKAAALLVNQFIGLPPALQKVTVVAGGTAVALGSVVVGLSAIRSAQASDTFDRIGLSAGALKETLGSLGASVQNVVGKIGSVGGAGVGETLGNLVPQKALSPEQAQQALLVKNAEKASALQIQAARKLTEEKAQAAFLSASFAEQEARANLALVQSQAGVQASTVATAEAKTRKAIASRISAEATLTEAAAASSSAVADVQAATAAQASAASDLKKATTSKIATIAEVAGSAASKAKAVALGGLTAATNVYTVAVGKKAAADVSATTAAVAGAAQLAIFAGAVLVVVENLKVLGILGNESAAALNKFRKELNAETKPPIEKEELGLIDRARVAVDQFGNVFRKNKKTEEDSINSVTSAALKEAQATAASSGLKEELTDIILRDSKAIDEKNKALRESGAIEALSIDQRSEQIALLETDLAAKQKEIDLAKQSGLEASGQIKILEEQAAVIQDSIGLLSGKTVVTREQAIANELQAKSLKELTDAQKSSNAEVELALGKQKALIAEQEASGELGQSEAISAAAKAEQSALEERLTNNKTLLEELQKQQQDKPFDPKDEGSVALQTQVVDTQKEQYDLRLQIAKAAITEEKRLQEERLSGLAKSEAENIATIEALVGEGRKVALEQQLAGVADAEQTQSRLTQIEIDGLNQRLTAKKKSVQDLQATKGLDPEEQKQAIADANKEILDIETELVQKQIDIQNKLKEERINSVKEAQAAANQQLTQSLAEQELALKQSLVNQSISEKDFEEQSLGNKEKSAAQKIALLEQEKASINELLTQGLIPQKEAQEQLGTIQAEITKEQIGLVDQQIEAQKRLKDETVKRIESEVKNAQLVNDLSVQKLEFDKAAIAQQNDLAQAQLGLVDAQSALQIQRLKFAQEDAQTETEAFELAKQIFEVEKTGTIAKLENERRVLDIKIQQQKLDNEIASSRAEIGIIEAQAAIEAAKARDASQEELSALSKVLELKQNIAAQTQASVASQDELFKIQKDTLAVNQELAQEQLAREEQKFAKVEEERAKLDPTLRGVLDTRFEDEDQAAKTVARTAIGNIGNKALLRGLSDEGGIVGEIGSLVANLANSGVKAAEIQGVSGKIQRVESSEEVVNILRQLLDATKSKERPNISVQSANPISDVISILRR